MKKLKGKSRKPEVSLDELQQTISAFTALEKAGYFDNIKELAKLHIQAVFYREKPTDRNPRHIYVVPEFQPWMLRVLTHHGIKTIVAARLMTDHEVEFHKDDKRMIYYSYPTWESLRTYEQLAYRDEKWDAMITECSQLYPITKNVRLQTKGRHKGQFEMVL
jgi:hypothetical protein